MNINLKNQKGIAPVLLLVGVAALIAIAVIVFVIVGPNPLGDKPDDIEAKTFSKPETRVDDLAKCRDTDYQGCDEAPEHSSWKDDGLP